MRNSAAKALWVLLLLSGSLSAATITFQGRLYDVTFIVPTNTTAGIVPGTTTNDLIFFIDGTGRKFLIIPSDTQARGDYDTVNRRFYMLRSDGQIESYGSIAGTQINLDGTFFSSTTQSPQLPTQPLETFARPSIAENFFADIAIVNDTLLGYRTDGGTNADEKIYTITREPSPLTNSFFEVPLNNATNPFLEYDPENDVYLTVQTQLDLTPGVNTDGRDRISVFRRTDGVLTSDILLENLVLIDPTLTYSGSAIGMALDPSTGVVYLLDAGNGTIARKIFVFTPRRPRILSIIPNTGGTAGGTAVTLNGENFPADTQVFFDGLAATDVVVESISKITAKTPAHALGAVDVTLAGTGISPAAPTTLAAGFTYVNNVPVTVLNASPTTGSPPLTVLFSIAGSTDLDGTLVSRVLDFGDGNSYTFPTDQASVEVSHAYAANGTYTARLRLTDNLGAIGTAQVVIVVGTGGEDVNEELNVRSVAFTLKEAGKDGARMTGELTLPDETELEDSTVTIGFATADFSGEIGAKNTATLPGGKINFKRVKRRDVPPNTHSFNVAVKDADLRAAFEQAGLNLDESNRGRLTVFVRIVTVLGRTLTYSKAIAVDIRAGNKDKASVKLMRR